MNIAKPQTKSLIGQSHSNARLDGTSIQNEILADKIQWAKDGLDRILAKFDGSENHKQIRMLRKRVLKKLLKEAADLTPNVEVSGAAASSPRPTRTPGSAYTRRVATAIHEDLCDALREHGKNSAEYAKQLDRASRNLRGSLPELLAVFLDYSSSPPR